MDTVVVVDSGIQTRRLGKPEKYNLTDILDLTTYLLEELLIRKDISIDFYFSLISHESWWERDARLMYQN